MAFDFIFFCSKYRLASHKSVNKIVGRYYIKLFTVLHTLTLDKADMFHVKSAVFVAFKISCLMLSGTGEISSYYVRVKVLLKMHVRVQIEPFCRHFILFRAF